MSVFNRILNVALGLFISGTIRMRELKSNLGDLEATRDRDLDCDFGRRCRWFSETPEADGPGTRLSPWNVAQGTPDPIVWFAATATHRQPRSPFAYLALQNGKGEMLTSGILPCQTGAGLLTFEYWLSSSATSFVCVLAADTGAQIHCSHPLQRSPGHATIKILGPILKPFKLAIIGNGQGFIIVDNIRYSGDVSGKCPSLKAILSTTPVPRPHLILGASGEQSGEEDGQFIRKPVETSGESVELLGPSVRQWPLRDLRNGSFIDTSDVLTCDFSSQHFGCRWGPGKGTNWALLNGALDAKLVADVGAGTVAPTLPGVVLWDRVSLLRSDPVVCQKADSQFTLSWWASQPSATLRLCARSFPQGVEIRCSERQERGGPDYPGPLILDFKGNIFGPFIWEIETSWDEGESGFILLDDIAYFADVCALSPFLSQTNSTTQSTTLPPLQTLVWDEGESGFILLDDIAYFADVCALSPFLSQTNSTTQSTTLPPLQTLVWDEGESGFILLDDIAYFADVCALSPFLSQTNSTTQSTTLPPLQTLVWDEGESGFILLDDIAYFADVCALSPFLSQTNSTTQSTTLPPLQTLVWDEGESGFILLDDIAYFADVCALSPFLSQTNSTTQSTTLPPLQTLEPATKEAITTTDIATTTPSVASYEEESYYEVGDYWDYETTSTTTTTTRKPYSWIRRRFRLTPPPKRPRRRRKTTPRPRTTTPPPTSPPAPSACDLLNCDFDDNTCEWSGVGIGSSHWRRMSGPFGTPLSRLTDIRPGRNTKGFLGARLHPRGRKLALLASPRLPDGGIKIFQFKFYRASRGVTLKLCGGSRRTRLGSSFFRSCQRIVPELTVANARKWNAARALILPQYTRVCRGVTLKLCDGSRRTRLGSSFFRSCQRIVPELTVANARKWNAARALILPQYTRVCRGVTLKLCDGSRRTRLGSSFFRSCQRIVPELTVANARKWNAARALILPQYTRVCRGVTLKLCDGSRRTRLGSSFFRSCQGIVPELTVANARKWNAARALILPQYIRRIVPELTVANARKWNAAGALILPQYTRVCRGVTLKLCDGSRRTRLGSSFFRSCQRIVPELTVANARKWNAARALILPQYTRVCRGVTLKLCDGSRRTRLGSSFFRSCQRIVPELTVANARKWNAARALILPQYTRVCRGVTLKLCDGSRRTRLGSSFFRSCQRIVPELTVANARKWNAARALILPQYTRVCRGVTLKLCDGSRRTRLGSSFFRSCQRIVPELTVANARKWNAARALILPQYTRVCRGVTLKLCDGSRRTRLGFSFFRSCQRIVPELTVANARKWNAARALILPQYTRVCRGVTLKLCDGSRRTRLGSSFFRSCQRIVPELTVANARKWNAARALILPQYTRVCRGVTLKLCDGSRRTRLGSSFFRSCQRIVPELTVANARKWNAARALILPQYTRVCRGVTLKLCDGSRRTRLGSSFFRSCQRIVPELTVANARKWNAARALILPQYTRVCRGVTLKLCDGSRRTRLGSSFFRSCQRIVPELTVANARKWNAARALILPQYTRLYLLAEHRGTNGHAAIAIDDLKVLNC